MRVLKAGVPISLLRILAAVLSTACGYSEAREIETGTELKLRWDNTLKYTAAWRVQDRSPSLLVNANTDDGNRNFDQGGLISNRLDILSELDVTYKNFGARVSGAAWYDAVYHHSNDNDSPATANAFSVPHNEFTDATRRLHGQKAELLDAFVFANGDLGGVPANARAGKHTLLWGESLLLADNGISYGQAPLDAIKGLSVPATQAKELFMPVGQVSGQLRPTPALSFAAYYQYDWRKTRIPEAGSYFSSADLLDDAGERLFVAAPATAFFRGDDLDASDSGQWGVSTRYSAPAIDTDFGFYYLRFHDKVPKIYLRPGANADLSVGKIGEYALVYPQNIRAIGASFATTFENVSVAGEVHARRNMPLASLAQVATPSADNDDNPLYAVGNTLHAQVSAVYVGSSTRLWDSATILGEVGWQKATSITKNQAAFDPSRERDAYGLRVLFTPTYFQVWPGVDLSVPMSVGYNPKGRSPIAGFNGGVDKGGTMSLGLSADYRKTWLAGVTYTRFYGDVESFQSLKDRDFVSLSVQRTY